MEIVDAHHHLWDLLVRDQDWIVGDDLAPLRRNFLFVDYESKARAEGVTASILVQTVTVAEETPELLALANRRDLIAGVVGWLDLTAPDVAERLVELRKLPGGDLLVGIRHQVQNEADHSWLIRPDVLRGLRAVSDAGLAYDLIVKPHHLPACVDAARALPHLTFVLDHLGKPPIATDDLEPWASHLRALAAEPNVVAKLSGLVTEARWHHWTVADLRPYAEVALEAFGPDRLMFGSDWPVCTLAARYDKVLGTTRQLVRDLSLPERVAIYSGTARRAYRLE